MKIKTISLAIIIGLLFAGTASYARINNPVGTSGFTKLGSDAPSIKMKKVTGTTGATEGSTTSIVHGLTISKVLGYNISVENTAGAKIPPAYIGSTEYQYNAYIDASDVHIMLSGSNSGNLKSKLITVLITYEE